MAGTSGESELIGGVRECEIPAGTTLFFPNITVAVTYAGENIPVDDKRAEAEFLLSEKGSGEAGFEACGIFTRIDDVVGPSSGLQTSRAQTSTFELFEDPEAIADGFWNAVRFESGVHKVRLQGSLCDPATGLKLFEIDMTYVIEVN